MSKVNKSIQLVPFDASEFLTDDIAIAEYITATLEIGDMDLILVALADVARAWSRSQPELDKRRRSEA